MARDFLIPVFVKVIKYSLSLSVSISGDINFTLRAEQFFYDGGSNRGGKRLDRKGCSKLGILRLTQVTSLEANPSAVLWNGTSRRFTSLTRRDWLDLREETRLQSLFGNSISLSSFPKISKTVVNLLVNFVVQFRDETNNFSNSK